MTEAGAGREHGVVAPVPVDPRGRTGPTRRQAAGPDWRRSSRGLYVPAHVAETPEQRVLEVGARLRSPALAITGWGAMRWRGARWSRGLDPGGRPHPVDVVGPDHQLRACPTHRLAQEPLAADEAEQVDGLRVTSAASAVCFGMRHAPS